MKQYSFFVTDWAPNGTSDLVIFDAENFLEPIACIPEALFGPPIDLADAWEFEPDEYLYPITKGQVLKFLACSPLDPNGQDVLAQLEPYFITRGAS